MTIESLTPKPITKPKQLREPLDSSAALNFRNQFNNPRFMVVHGRKVPYIRIAPEKPRSSTPVVLTPGLSENPNLLEKLLKHLHADRRIVYTFEQPQDKMPIERNGHPKAQEHKIANVLALTEEAVRTEYSRKKNGKAVLMGRSDGAINAVFAAEKRPDLVDSVVLIDGKLTRSNGFSQLTKDFSRHALETPFRALKHPETNKPFYRGIARATTHVFSHPITMLQEVVAIGGSDIKPSERKLLAKGIGVRAIHGSNDRIFPLADTLQDLESVRYKKGQHQPVHTEKQTIVFTKDAKFAPVLDKFTVVTGKNHNSIYNDREYFTIITDELRAADTLSKQRREAAIKAKAAMERSHNIGKLTLLTTRIPSPREEKIA